MNEMSGVQVINNLDLFRAALDTVMRVLINTPPTEERGRHCSFCSLSVTVGVPLFMLHLLQDLAAFRSKSKLGRYHSEADTLLLFVVPAVTDGTSLACFTHAFSSVGR
jgi:hypothetical protein